MAARVRGHRSGWGFSHLCRIRIFLLCVRPVFRYSWYSSRSTASAYFINRYINICREIFEPAFALRTIRPYSKHLENLLLYRSRVGRLCGFDWTLYERQPQHSMLQRCFKRFRNKKTFHQSSGFAALAIALTGPIYYSKVTHLILSFDKMPKRNPMDVDVKEYFLLSLKQTVKQLSYYYRRLRMGL